MSDECCQCQLTIKNSKQLLIVPPHISNYMVQQAIDPTGSGPGEDIKEGKGGGGGGGGFTVPMARGGVYDTNGQE